MMTNPQPVGLFGGTFDPIHFGHLRAASEVRALLDLPDLRLLPSGHPPHRNATVASAQDRLAMIRLAVENYSDLIIDDRELRRKGRSYMVDTLEEIRSEFGDAPVMLIVGQDSANSLDSWHLWEQLFGLAHLVIMARPEATHQYSQTLANQIDPRMVMAPADLLQSPSGRVLALEVTQLAISSTEIRNEIAAGRSPRFLLPDAVIEYISNRQLYQQ